MRVTVSCAGRFHAFELASQLFQRGMLQRFLTTTLNDRLLPNRALPENVKSNSDFLARIITIPLPEYACFGIRKLPLPNAQSLAYLVKDNSYDRAAAKHIERTDLFVGWASQSLFQLREAKTRGAITIIERGSSHISEQYRLIEEEHAKFGLKKVTRGWADGILEEKQLKEYHEADYIMVPSEFARQSFIEKGFPSSKILKVRYGVDLSNFYPASQTRSTADPTILFVGAIGFQKGIPYLLQAARSMRKRGLTFRLKLIGRMEAEFANWLQSSGLGDTIDEHIPFVPNIKLREHFQAASVFCLPSIQEGLALVIAEAMASGIPVVATENTGASEFIANGVSGLIVAPADADALADALFSLLTNPQHLTEIGHTAAESAKHFSWKSYGDDIERTYAQLLQQKNTIAHKGDEIAEYYDEYWNRDKGWTPEHSFTSDQLQLHFGNAFASTDSVLDVGCGDASNYQSWLVRQVGHLAAIDISPSGIAHAKQMGLDAKLHDLTQPFPYPDNSFEGATCIEVLEHLYDPKFAVTEILRVLKPGGLLVTSVPNNGYFRERLRALTKAEMSTSITDFGNEWKGAHIRFYSLKSFRRMLEVSGFEIESIKSNDDSSIFDGLDAFGGYFTQHVTSLLRKHVPKFLRLGFLEDVWPSLFAPHLVVRARKPLQ